MIISSYSTTFEKPTGIQIFEVFFLKPRINNIYSFHNLNLREKNLMNISLSVRVLFSTRIEFLGVRWKKYANTDVENFAIPAPESRTFRKDQRDFMKMFTIYVF